MPAAMPAPYMARHCRRSAWRVYARPYRIIMISELQAYCRSVCRFGSVLGIILCLSICNNGIPARLGTLSRSCKSSKLKYKRQCFIDEWGSSMDGWMMPCVHSAESSDVHGIQSSVHEAS